MESFITRDLIEPVWGFIAACPFLGDYNISFPKKPVTQKLITTKPEGSALEYNGSALTESKTDVHGNQRCNRQANLQLWLLRKSNHNVQRTEIADFLFNFEQWVEWANFNGLCPKLSNMAQDQQYETMWADTGVYFAEWEDGSEASLYLVQLHISYFNYYQKITKAR